jgi:NTE family protein
LVNNDIAWAERFAEREHLHGRDLTLTIIRPTEPLSLNLMKFTSDDIGRMIVSGYQAGTDVMKAQR